MRRKRRLGKTNVYDGRHGPDIAVETLVEDRRNSSNKMTHSSSPRSKAQESDTTFSPRTENTHGNDVNEEEDNNGVDDDSYIDINHSSFEEQCGFVLHVMIVLVAVTYTTWILSFYCLPLPIVQNATLDGTRPALWVYSSNKPTPGPPVWTIIIPLAVILLFFLIPIVYGGCINRSAVVASTKNRQQSISILQDTHTIRPRYVSPKNAYDDYNATCYYQNPMSWTPARYGKNSFNIDQGIVTHATSTVPDICEIDVADINDLIHSKHKIPGPT